MNMNRKIQLAAGVVIANATLAMSLLSPQLALATTCVNIVECTTASYCAAHTNNKYCPPQFGCRAIVQSACMPPQNFGPCIGFYSYTCGYLPG